MFAIKFLQFKLECFYSYIYILNTICFYQEEIKKLKKELENFDPSFFEEIEDLKYNYKEEVKKNILLEEKLKKLSEQFGVELTSPVAASEHFEDEEGNPDNFPIY